MSDPRFPYPNARLLIVSTSKIHGSAYMSYLLEDVKNFFTRAESIIFIPYARPGGIGMDDYTELPRQAFAGIGLKVKGLHEYDDPAAALREAQGVFTGGGNTFLLLKTLYEKGLVPVLRDVVGQGTPYMGSSAGSNITGLSISTTNDMPIVYPPSFDALGLVPFNINPHYLDPQPDSKHQGESRETRINEFHGFNEQRVVGLREGSWLLVEGHQIRLKGPLSARIFEKNREPYEQAPGDVSFLLKV